MGCTHKRGCSQRGDQSGEDLAKSQEMRLCTGKEMLIAAIHGLQTARLMTAFF